MLLVVDIGNTNTVLGLYRDGSLITHFRVESRRGRTSDEYRVLFSTLLHLAGVGKGGRVHGSIIASVVPALTEVIASAIRETAESEPLIVGPGMRTGISVLVENPREVGADRIVNSVAAFERHRCGLIIVDFGTATTFDCVSPKGEYLGGAIVPGIQISAEALSSRAAKLPRAEIARPPRAVGKNTVHSMQSGIVFGYVALVDGLVERLRSELGFPCKVIATGGLAATVHADSTTIEEIDEFLTLDGLRILYDRNLAPGSGSHDATRSGGHSSGGT